MHSLHSNAPVLYDASRLRALITVRATRVAHHGWMDGRATRTAPQVGGVDGEFEPSRDRAMLV